MSDSPNFLIEWESPWRGFASSVRPALQRSPRQLMGECQTGLVPISGMVVSWVLEFALLLVVITIPATLARMQPYSPLSRPKYDVIYFSGESLPQTTDTSGSQAGHSGRSGGRAALHRRQVNR